MSSQVEKELLNLLHGLKPTSSPLLDKSGLQQIGTRALLVHPGQLSIKDLAKDVKVPVRVQTHWHVSANKDPNVPGEPVTGAPHPKFTSKVDVNLGRIESVALWLMPAIVEMADGKTDIGIQMRYLHVKVTLKTDAVKLATETVPPVGVSDWLPPIPVPKLVLPIVRSAYLHIHKGFGASDKGVNLTDPDKVAGAAFWLIHPDCGLLGGMDGSLIPSGVILNSVLGATKHIQDTLRSLVQVGGALGTLAGLVALQDNIIGLGQNVTAEMLAGVKQLNDYDLLLHEHTVLGVETQNDIEGEDEASSLVITGKPGHMVMFYGDDSFDRKDDGSFRVEVGPLGLTIIENLTGEHLKTKPHSKNVDGEPLFRVIYASDDGTWNDTISSLRFM